MVSLEDAVIARLESGGHRFEILIDPNEAQNYKEGNEIDWEDSIAAVSYTHLTLPTIRSV